MGRTYKWYRLLYSLGSLFVIFFILFYSALIPSFPILVPSELLTYIGFVLAGIGTMIAIKSFKGQSLSRFLGMEPHDDLEVKELLTTLGPYEWVRHPLYAGLILVFLGFFLYLPHLTSLIHLLALLGYLPFGIYFEEKKLLAQYGQAYVDYRSKVPALFPKLKK